MRHGPHINDICRLPLILRREWWDARALREYQEKRLRALVRHAYSRVPFYRSLWDAAGVRPEAVQSLEDLAILPLVESRDFKEQPQQRVIADGTDIARCVVVQTSGSTGQPLSVAYTPGDHFEVVKAMSVRFYRANGVKLTDRILSLARNPDAMTTRGWFQRLGFWRRAVLPVLADSESWLEPAARMQPDIITGFTLSLVEFAQALSGHPEIRIRPRVVFASGCRMEQPDREMLESVFKARVVDSYGGYETGFLAWQCAECADYHVNADCVLLEVLKDGRPVGPGETGEVYVTNLVSRAMPFIRYPLGDVVTLSDRISRCGRALPLIRTIWGRCDDYVLLPSGRRIGPYPFYLLVLPMPWLREWQVVQRRDGTCLLRIVPRDTDDSADRLAALKTGLNDILLGEVSAEVVFAPAIERDLKTKWKSIASEFTVPNA